MACLPGLVWWERLVGGGFLAQERSSLLPAPPTPGPTVLRESGDARPPCRGVRKPAVPAPTQREAGAGPCSLACWKCDIDVSFWPGLPGHKSNFAAGTSQH